MGQRVEYTLSIADRASGTLSRVAGASSGTVAKLNQLTARSQALQGATKDLGGSMSVLRQKIELLRAEKELIDPRNLGQLKQYNKEIGSLTRQVDKLDNIGSKGGLSRYLGQLGGSLGGLLTNPIAVIGAGLAFAGKQAMNFDQGMAKVNITAQLDDKAFAQLKTKTKEIAAKNKVDVTMAPVGLEKIISQVGDVDTSLSILDSTLKGSKAGFTDMDTVAGALAQTLSIVGKENATAEEGSIRFLPPSVSGQVSLPTLPPICPR